MSKAWWLTQMARMSIHHHRNDHQHDSLNRFWVSDEYGPYIYLFSADGALLHAIAPPAAVLPTRDGFVNFTSVEDPAAGRAANQGMSSSSAGTLAVRLIDLLAHLLTCR